jgi:hypothetical protein
VELMAKIKAGTVHTAGSEAVTVTVENSTSAGAFEVCFLGQRLGIEQARRLSEILTSGADKAEILDAAMAG